MASMTAQQGIFSCPLTVTEAILPSIDVKSVMQELKRISTPRLTSSRRIFRMTSESISVPTWGFASTAMLFSAPNLTSVSTTSSALASLIRVVSLPSENAPAPPSPNMMLLLGSGSPPPQNESTSLLRSEMGLPLSRTMTP